MKKLLACLGVLVALTATAQAAPKTKAQLTTEINTNWPDNTAHAITPALLRDTVIDIVNSYYDLNGGSALACAASNWISSLPTLSSILCTQPDFTDLTGLLNVAQLPALNNGQVWIGNGSNIAAPRTMSGDCTITLAGVITCLKVNGTNLGTLAIQNANALAVTGVTQLTGLPACTNATDACPKSYIDGLSSGIVNKGSSRLITAAVLPNSPTYSNGASGVGATLTAGSNSTLTVDGTVAALNDVVTVKNQASAFQNGIYYVSTAGSGGAAWVLTRCAAGSGNCVKDFNIAANMTVGSYTYATAGATNIGNAYTLGASVTTVGTDALTFILFSSTTPPTILVTTITGATAGDLLSTANSGCSGSTPCLADSGIAASQHIFSTPAAYYANVSTGNDSNDCLAATVTGGHGPCLTLQHVIDVASTYNNGNNQIVVNLLGNFTTGATLSGPIAFSAYNRLVAGIKLIGGSSATTSLDDTSGNCGTLIVTGSGTNVILANLTLKKTSGCGTSGAAVFAEQNAVVNQSVDIVFGVSAGQHIHAESSATYEISSNYSISGNALYHWAASTGAHILNDGYTVTCAGVTAFSTFFYIDSHAVAEWFSGSAFSGCGAVTGSRWSVLQLGLINAFGNASFWTQLPGNSVGVTTEGGRLSPVPVPTLPFCTNGSLDANSTDNAFSIAWSGNGPSCTVNFGVSKPLGAVCTASNTSGASMGVSTSTTGVFLQSGFLAGESAYVICVDRPW